mgnify:CR=1 FL=1
MGRMLQRNAVFEDDSAPAFEGGSEAAFDEQAEQAADLFSFLVSSALSLLFGRVDGYVSVNWVGSLVVQLD